MDDQLPDDGLKWFGEGFDGFPKRLPEDCVEYVIHIIDQKLDSIAMMRSRLNAIIKAANELKKKYLKDYIWQRDAFDLTIYPKLDLAKPTPSTTQTPPYLRGRTNFGDSVADEWVIVYFLRELSKQFPTAWTRVYDTDGEFLLIEAAASLPKWLNPEIADNRIWINDGHLKIIPLANNSAPRNLSLQDALSTLTTTPNSLLIDPAIEKEAFHRLRDYPTAISSSLHHALTTIPRRLAYILHRNPAYISPAVEAFYLRDPISLKPLNTKDISTLSFPPEDSVTVSVKYTKVGFAQLRSQIFDPPPAWTAVVPYMQDEKRAMGMKLACGFEMMVGDAQLRNLRTVREVKLLLEDLESGEEVLPNDEEISRWEKRQDGEEWLDIDYNDFEDELAGKKKNGGKGKGGFGDEGAQENLRKMVERFQDFLDDDEAGADGVDAMDEDDDDDDDDDDDEDTASNDSNEFSTKGENEQRGEQSREDPSSSTTDEAEFEKSIKKTMTMPTHHIEESGLLDEARKLALEDEDDEPEIDEDEEMRKVIALMENELKGHGALSLDGDGYIRKKKASEKREEKSQNDSKGIGAKAKDPSSPPTTTTDKPIFGPVRPPHLQPASSSSSSSTAINNKSNPFLRFNNTLPSDDELGHGEEELSSDDDVDEDYNDVNLDLAKNMLEAFKGQAGMAGPAGNLMKAFGVGMPRDED